MGCIYVKPLLQNLFVAFTKDVQRKPLVNIFEGTWCFYAK